MSKLIKFELELDATDPRQISALSNLLNAIGGKSGELLEAKEEETEKPASKKVKKKAQPTKQEQKPEKVEEEKDSQPDKEEESEFELSEVRDLLGKVISQGDGDVRDKCAAKLKSFDAKNVSTLDPKHYGAFMDFLNGLL